MKKILRTLDSTGDTVVEFDPADAVATAEAKALFDRLRAEGRAAFAVNRAGGAPDAKLTDFSQLENETVLIPRVVGG